MLKKIQNKVGTTKFSKLVLAFAFTYLICFTCFVLVVNLKGGDVSDMLIEKTFDVFGIEFLALAGIKVSDTVADKINILKNTFTDNEE